MTADEKRDVLQQSTPVRFQGLASWVEHLKKLTERLISAKKITGAPNKFAQGRALAINIDLSSQIDDDNRVIFQSGREFSLMNTYRVFLITLLLVLAPYTIAAAVKSAPEHPVIKPMTGAKLNTDRPRFDEFGQMAVRYREDMRTINEIAEGHFWRLEYKLDDRDVSKDEIIANYASEVRSVGGEVIDKSSTRLRFRIFNSSGETTWGILDARSNGSYEIDIVDEASLDLSLEFDADDMLDAIKNTGHVDIYGILFDTNKVKLLPGSGEVVDTVADVLRRDSRLRLEIRGHTDSTGSEERNRALSLELAQTVVTALFLYGIDPERLVARGFGADEPVAENQTAEGRKLNRRVELVRAK